MIQLNFKKISLYFVMMIIGLSLISNGILYFIFEASSKDISDEEIKEKAKDLGMIEIKKQIK